MNDILDVVVAILLLAFFLFIIIPAVICIITVVGIVALCMWLTDTLFGTDLLRRRPGIHVR